VSQLSHAQFPLRRHPDLLVDHRRARSAAVAEPRGANVESRDRLRWPASFRNGGRHQIGTVADIKSECLRVQIGPAARRAAAGAMRDLFEAGLNEAAASLECLRVQIGPAARRAAAGAMRDLFEAGLNEAAASLAA